MASWFFEEDEEDEEDPEPSSLGENIAEIAIAAGFLALLVLDTVKKWQKR